MNIVKRITLSLVIVFTVISSQQSFAQDSLIIDQIVSVIGSSIIKESDIQNQFQQMKAEGHPVGDLTSCRIVEDVMYQKLLLDQAVIDSIEVSESTVDDEIQRRIDVFAEQIGSYEKLEKFYEKTLLEIKTEWRDVVKEQMLAQRMQQSIVADIQVSPKDVRSYFENLTADSLPLINPQYELAQIAFSPRITIKQKIELRAKLDGIRQRAINGENFSTLAVLYSDDLASSKKGGDLGYVARGELVQEFAAAAFKLKVGEISRIIETEYGFHIIKMIDRKGERINVRHILLKPKPTNEDFLRIKGKADTVYSILKSDTLSFSKAALIFSDDKQTKNNGGLMVNPYTGNAKFEAKQIDPIIFNEVTSLKKGEISRPFLATDETGNQVYKIVKLISSTKAHKASLTEDYQTIKEIALAKKKEQALTDWIIKKQKETYIKLSPNFSQCDFKYKGWYR